jgi:hypothetical protein
MKKSALIIGLCLNLVAFSCVALKRGRNGESPWTRIGITKDEYEKMQNWKSFTEVYHENIDRDSELEKIIIKSRPFERGQTGLIIDYSTSVEIYIKRAEIVRRDTLIGEEKKIRGENEYHLKRVFMWRGAPVKKEDVAFEEKILKVQDKKIVYDGKRDNFYFDKS